MKGRGIKVETIVSIAFYLVDKDIQRLKIGIIQITNQIDKG